MSSSGADRKQDSSSGTGWIRGLAMLEKTADAIVTVGKKLYDLYNMRKGIRYYNSNGQMFKAKQRYFGKNKGPRNSRRNNGRGKLDRNNTCRRAPPQRHLSQAHDDSEKKEIDQMLERERANAILGVCLCVVCMDSVRQVVLEPCGHVSLCSDCAVGIKREAGSCPVCREIIRGIKLCYLS